MPTGIMWPFCGLSWLAAAGSGQSLPPSLLLAYYQPPEQHIWPGQSLGSKAGLHSLRQSPSLYKAMGMVTRCNLGLSVCSLILCFPILPLCMFYISSFICNSLGCTGNTYILPMKATLAVNCCIII